MAQSIINNVVREWNRVVQVETSPFPSIQGLIPIQNNVHLSSGYLNELLRKHKLNVFCHPDPVLVRVGAFNDVNSGMNSFCQYQPVSGYRFQWLGWIPAKYPFINNDLTLEEGLRDKLYPTETSFVSGFQYNPAGNVAFRQQYTPWNDIVPYRYLYLQPYTPPAMYESFLARLETGLKTLQWLPALCEYKQVKTKTKSWYYEDYSENENVSVEVARPLWLRDAIELEQTATLNWSKYTQNNTWSYPGKTITLIASYAEYRNTKPYPVVLNAKSFIYPKSSGSNSIQSDYGECSVNYTIPNFEVEQQNNYTYAPSTRLQGNAIFDSLSFTGIKDEYFVLQPNEVKTFGYQDYNEFRTMETLEEADQFARDNLIVNGVLKNETMYSSVEGGQRMQVLLKWIPAHWLNEQV